MLLKCHDCGKMISVSSTGYGDKNALAAFMNKVFGDHFATRWLTCDKCCTPYCDKCASKRGRLLGGSKCECGGTLSEKNNLALEEGEAIARKMVEELQEKEKNFDEWVKTGVQYFNAHEYAKAVEWLGKAIDVLPQKAGAGLCFLRAQACSEIGEYKQEIQNLSKAIELEPDKGMFYGNRGISYFELGDHKSAVADFTKHIELEPNNAMSYNNRGAAYQNLGDRQRARMDYGRALELNPDGEAGRLARQNLVRLG